MGDKVKKVERHRRDEVRRTTREGQGREDHRRKLSMVEQVLKA